MRSYQLCGTPATAPRRLPALYCHTRLSPHRLQPCAHLTRTCGTRATAPRRQPALHVAEPLSPHGRGRVRPYDLCVVRCDRIASPACFPYCRAAQPNKLQPCAHLTTLHACDRTARCQPAFCCAQLSPPRLQPCALTTIWLAFDRPAESAYRSLSRSPTFTGRAVCVHTNYVARLRPHRGVNLPLLSHCLASIGCDVRSSYYVWHALNRTAAPACSSWPHSPALAGCGRALILLIWRADDRIAARRLPYAIVQL